MNLLPSAVHASSTNESGDPRIYSLALFANSPFSTFILSPMNLLPNAVNASSTHESGAPRIFSSAVCQFSILHFYTEPHEFIA